MIEETYKKAFSEVYVIINTLDEELQLMIPSKLKNFIDDYKDDNYIFNYDYDLPLYNQHISDESKAILTIIYRNYMCDAEEKKELDKKLNQNEIEYNTLLTNKMFNRSNKITANNNDTQLVEYKDNILKRIFQKIKAFFGISS